MDDELDIRVIDPQQEHTFLENLIRDDPWEAVVYLAANDQEEAARRLRDRLLKAKDNELRQLQAPMLTDGVLLSGPDDTGRCIIGVSGQRYDVAVAIDPMPPAEDFAPGREVWVQPGNMAIVKLRETYVQGEAAPVVETVDPAALAEQSAQTDRAADTPVSDAPKRILLRVKSRQEEIIVEAVPALAQRDPAVGDTVRILPTLGIALELLARGRKDVLLDAVPDVEYQDIGGLKEQIDQIRDSIESPYAFPAVFQRFNLPRPRGILLHGPPGCGKTMIAKAIANSLSKQIERSLREMQVALDLYLHLQGGSHDEDTARLYRAWCNLELVTGATDVPQQLPDDTQALQFAVERFLRNRGVRPLYAADEMKKIRLALEQGAQSYFVSIKGPELLSKWVGETESTIRGIFAMARARATFYTPVVLFFDELESMFSRRGSGISSDVQKTIVPQLLAEIDGIEETRNVIVIGSSNRFDLIDPAVLRPGRLDFKIEIARPNRDRDAPQSILAKYLTPDVPFPPAVLDIDLPTQAALGTAAVQSAALADCISASLDRLVQSVPGLQAVVLLTDLYREGQPPARKLTVAATSGIDPESERAVLDSWLADDGIGWRVARTGEFAAQTDEHLFAWPLVAPDEKPVVWGVLMLRHERSQSVAKAQPQIDALAAALPAAIQARRTVANQLIERVLDILFHADSRLIISELIEKQRALQQFGREPRTLEKPVKDIISGAMLESIVARAKRDAVKREIVSRAQGNHGVTWVDLYNGIRAECEEGKDQYVFELYGDNPYERGQAYHDTERFHVTVKLPPPESGASAIRWLGSKTFAWRAPQAGPAARERARQP